MIGQNIKTIRELRGLTQSELAYMIGVSDKTVSSWEINRTEPKMGMIEKLSAALNCKKTDIIGWHQDEQAVLLDENEVKMLNAYRGLSDPDKQKIMRMIQVFEEEGI